MTAHGKAQPMASAGEQTVAQCNVLEQGDHSRGSCEAAQRRLEGDERSPASAWLMPPQQSATGEDGGAAVPAPHSTAPQARAAPPSRGAALPPHDTTPQARGAAPQDRRIPTWT